MLKQVRENKELSDKLRDLEKRTSLYQDRLKEYEDILAKQQDDSDKRESLLVVVTAENEGLKKTNAFMEG